MKIEGTDAVFVPSVVGSLCFDGWGRTRRWTDEIVDTRMITQFSVSWIEVPSRMARP